MRRLVGILVALVLVAAVPSAFAADKTKLAKGTVKTVAADSLTVTDAAGKDWTFAVDTNTKVVASGGTHKTAETKAMGKSPLIVDTVKVGGKVSVKYHELDGGKMHAAEVRVL
jgi:ABC-type Fe3+-hydroxamate transport system substrate-binding protein